ncbi:hypothetical protein MCOR27_007654 [Pyricularia oryzae]|uniref:Uncharacterized protein n=1 Tax=Pyricularia grisea TaxID=148305 RepID=A0ABQ8NRU2_PYRGI|nr:hypothetical protein MCOR01_002574 [Pyricularia oryzae]KAI6300954.1 hypothetical protein MCOR33_003436 [Pyricularia grisea]KAI6273904.1 hypothetical protein MCOR27_007654 [Pyricularia oryzae]KAI6317734.1 hypothetical protein MCOR29_006189 [Pyricularia oryzae]KAI6353875.1 hypothetical protein MCOR31_011624 [Pyricularia oryzae]
MHATFITFLIAPLVVFGASSFTVGFGSTGGRCCRDGVADPSNTCKNLGLNSYACSDYSSSAPKEPGPKFGDKPKGGCDQPEIHNFPTGRDVKTFVVGSTVNVTDAATGNIEVGFIGCAE